MQLHAKNIALSAGVTFFFNFLIFKLNFLKIPTYLVEDAVRFMKNRGKLSSDTSIDYLKAYDVFSTIKINQI